MTTDPAPLDGATVVNAGVNLPAIATGYRLAELGASVTKVEPPGGDPTASMAPRLYADLTPGQTVVRLDLKQADGRERLGALLQPADVLVTSSRPSALARLGLDRGSLADRYPRLVHVALVGRAAPHQDVPGHDLTYVAAHGLVSPPALPRTLVADLGGAERAATAAVALLLARERGLAPRHVEVALEDSAAFFALPLTHGVTAEDGILGGGDPYYGLYATADGWIAVAALEPHFRRRLRDALEASEEAFAEVFAGRPSAEWLRWAAARDLPVAPVAPPGPTSQPTVW